MFPKSDLRRMLRRTRQDFVERLSRAEFEAAQRRLDEALAAEMRPARCFAAYVPMGSEFPALAALAHAGDRETALPRIVNRSEPMAFFAWKPGDPLEPGLFGLLQPPPRVPVEPDLVLVPLLGFDRALGRLGQGAGHYDRYFAAHPRARRIGLAWSCQQVDAVPRDPWDVPLHAIFTERGWIGPPP